MTVVTLDEAINELRRDPGRTVRARLAGFTVEMRRVDTEQPAHSDIGSAKPAPGPWEGEDEPALLEGFLRGWASAPISHSATPPPRAPVAPLSMILEELHRARGDR